jgi:hypothetical protein
MQYLHHLGILANIPRYLQTLKFGGYYITLPKPKSNIILTPYCDNILNHGTNEGIVKLVTLMVKGNETIIKLRVLQLHIKILLK